MAIDSNIIGSAVGGFIAVIGAVAVIFIQQWWRSHQEKKATTTNAIKELKYNVDIIIETKKNTIRLIEQLSVGQTQLYFTHASSSILSVSLQQAYNEGVLFAKLSSTEVAKLNNDALTFFGVRNIENFVSDRIGAYQRNEITQEELYGILVWIRDTASEAIVIMKKASKKLAN